MRKVLRFSVPALLLALLVGLLYVGMQDIDRSLASPLIDLPAPALPPADGEARTWLVALDGRPHLVNFWASWCLPCLEEHPFLMRLAGEGIPIIGVNYKDDPAAAERWLRRHGDPFAVILEDRSGRFAIDWGVYGVPETYVVDGEGVIRFKQVGAVDRAFMEEHRALLLSGAGG